MYQQMQWSLYPEMLKFGILSEKKGHVVTIHDIKTLSAHKKNQKEGAALILLFFIAKPSTLNKNYKPASLRQPLAPIWTELFATSMHWGTHWHFVEAAVVYCKFCPFEWKCFCSIFCDV